MSDDYGIKWPKNAFVHPNYLNSIKHSRMSGKVDEYLEENGIETDRQLQLHEMQIFCRNLSTEMAEEIIDGIRTVIWADHDEDHWVVTFPRVG